MVDLKTGLTSLLLGSGEVEQTTRLMAYCSKAIIRDLSVTSSWESTAW